MGKNFSALLLGVPLLIGAFSSSSTYQLQSYGINGAASNNGVSATYQLEGASGQLVSIDTNSTTYKVKPGSLQAQQANVPPAPTLNNGSGAYYNKLGCIIAVGGNASDATFEIAVSTDNFTTTNYVQADGTLGPTPLFRSYAQWGSSSGTMMVGLQSATTYQVKVAAMQGMFTHSAFGPAASSTTASPSLSFSVTPNSLTLPNLYSGNLVTGGTITTDMTTNASFGGTIYAADSNAGLRSSSTGNTIPTSGGDLSSLGRGYGLRSTGTSQTSGGPLSSLSPFNGGSTVTGAFSTTPQAVFTSTTAITGAAGTSQLLAKSGPNDNSATDYADTISFVAAASF